MRAPSLLSRRYAQSRMGSLDAKFERAVVRCSRLSSESAEKRSEHGWLWRRCLGCLGEGGAAGGRAVGCSHCDVFVTPMVSFLR